jgi:hypothetical protein
MGDGEPATATAERNFIERYVTRVIVKPQISGSSSSPD